MRPPGRMYTYSTHCTFPPLLLIIDIKALARDGFRCVITRTSDETSFESNAERSTELRHNCKSHNNVALDIQTNRILSESTAQSIETCEEGAAANVVCGRWVPGHRSPIILPATLYTWYYCRPEAAWTRRSCSGSRTCWWCPSILEPALVRM